MHHKKLFVFVVSLLLVFVAACTTALAAPLPQDLDQEQKPSRTITVNGVGRITIAPDIARISIGVETMGESAADATRENSALAEKVIEALVGFEVAEADIRTSNFSVYARQDRDRDGNLLGVTYVVQNTIVVTVRDLDKLGEVLDAVVQSGANNISGIQFDLADRTQASSAALDAAVQDAKRQAEILSAAAEVELGQVLTINSFSNVPVFPIQRSAVEFAAGAIDVPVSPGELEISADVTVIYEIQ